MSDIHGFDAPIENSIDGVASRDYALELLSAIAIMSNTLSRLCADLYVWATPEFGYIEVDDSVAICSSIMPQKKNPITLEYVKGKATFDIAQYSLHEYMRRCWRNWTIRFHCH